ncbi:MAG: hypothetical protein ACKVP4_12805 [Hyphomicrobium sp.]
MVRVGAARSISCGLFFFALSIGIFQTQTPAAADDFCDVLAEIVDSVPTGFKDITKADGKATVSLPGTSNCEAGLVDSSFICTIVDGVDKASAGKAHAAFSEKVAACYPNAKREASKSPAFLNVNTFRLQGSSVIVSVQVTSITGTGHDVTIDIYDLDD